MTDLVIRDLDPAVEAQLRERAAENGLSIEDEVKSILDCLLGDERPQDGLGTRITRRFAVIGLRPGEELQTARLDLDTSQLRQVTTPFSKAVDPWASISI